MSRNFTSEQTLIDRLVASDTEAFEEIYRRYAFSLYSYSINKLDASEDAKRIVRDIFIRLWEKRQHIPVDFALQVHLYSEIRREVLNCLNEKLLTESDLNMIRDKVLPGFTVYKLQEARRPVYNNTGKPFLDQATKEKYPQQPWWNQYPGFIRTRGMKLALEKVLHMF